MISRIYGMRSLHEGAPMLVSSSVSKERGTSEGQSVFGGSRFQINSSSFSLSLSVISVVDMAVR